MRKRLFANLGFLLQIAGLLTILPITVGLVFDETQAVVSLFIACVGFLGCGFLLNALCERKELDFKGSNFLFLITFIALPLIGAFPYFYMSAANPSFPLAGSNGFETFTNGYFESVSGFTTTGFSFVANPEGLPVSILIYRSLTELMGGVGIVFLLLSFFQSRKSLNNLSNTAGIENVCGSLKKTYFSVLAVYGGFILVFTGIFYALGFTNIIHSGTFVIDTITGGYQPAAASYQQYLSWAPEICIVALMLLGSVNFAFNYNFFTGKLKKAFSKEIIVYLLIIVAGTISVSLFAGIGAFDSLFHVVSMSSSTGQS
jgi:trk system potassium uptake protein